MSSMRTKISYGTEGPSKFEARGVRKVTTGITSLWQPSPPTCRPVVEAIRPSKARVVGKARVADESRGPP
ncbi:hypothetical protein CsSME_00033929 [Camellia sinensis var. sinensis]